MWAQVSQVTLYVDRLRRRIRSASFINCVISHTSLNRIPQLPRTIRPNPAYRNPRQKCFFTAMAQVPRGLHFSQPSCTSFGMTFAFLHRGGDRHGVAIRQRKLPPPISAGNLWIGLSTTGFSSRLPGFFCMEFPPGGTTPRPRGNAGPITNGDL